MPNLHHFASALLSNFQSAVAKAASRVPTPPGAVISAADLDQPPIDFNNDMIQAAAQVGNVVNNTALGQPAPALTSGSSSVRMRLSMSRVAA
jgi:hypothetical protein